MAHISHIVDPISTPEVANSIPEIILDFPMAIYQPLVNRSVCICSVQNEGLWVANIALCLRSITISWVEGLFNPKIVFRFYSTSNLLGFGTGLPVQPVS